MTRHRFAAASQRCELIADWEISGYEHLIPSMTCDEKDGHVLAAAVRGGASQIVTGNVRDFPAESLAPYDIEAIRPDGFLLNNLHMYPKETLEVIQEQAAALRHPATHRERHAIDSLSLWRTAFLRGDGDNYRCDVLRRPACSLFEKKRALVVRTVLQREGFTAQRDLVGQVPWNETPAFTLDVAMVVVERALREAGATGGATREEIRAAMDDLVRSFDAVAVPDRNAIVIRTPGSSRHVD